MGNKKSTTCSPEHHKCFGATGGFLVPKLRRRLWFLAATPHSVSEHVRNVHFSLPEVSPSDLFVEFRDASSGSIKQFQADLLRTAEGNTSFLYRYRPHNSYPGNIVFNVFYKRQRLASETINGIYTLAHLQKY